MAKPTQKTGQNGEQDRPAVAQPQPAASNEPKPQPADRPAVQESRTPAPGVNALAQAAEAARRTADSVDRSESVANQDKGKTETSESSTDQR